MNYPASHLNTVLFSLYHAAHGVKRANGVNSQFTVDYTTDLFEEIRRLKPNYIEVTYQNTRWKSMARINVACKDEIRQFLADDGFIKMEREEETQSTNIAPIYNFHAPVNQTQFNTGDSLQVTQKNESKPHKKSPFNFINISVSIIAGVVTIWAFLDLKCNNPKPDQLKTNQKAKTKIDKG